MPDLPEPSFVDRDARVILADCIAQYEAATGRPLEPSQVERLLIDLIAYRESLIRIAIQEAAKQNLRAYARYPMIDFLAELVGAARLAAQPAKTTERFTLDVVQPVDSIFPSGTRVRTKDGKVTFTTDKDLTIAAGDLTGDVDVTSTDPGPLGNGYAEGQVSELVDGFAFGVTVTNVVETKDGSAAEDTERLRARLPDAIAQYAAAGPGDAYKIHALAAHPDVLDVHVSTPTPGTVRVAVLAVTGIPDGTLLTTVEDALTPEDVRPICDTVEVVAATAVNYAITARLTLYKGANATTAVDDATAAAEAYRNQRAAGLGRTPVPSQISKALQVGGVYSVAIDAPDGTPLGLDDWAQCTAITITVDGFSDEEEP